MKKIIGLIFAFSSIAACGHGVTVQHARIHNGQLVLTTPTKFSGIPIAETRSEWVKGKFVSHSANTPCKEQMTQQVMRIPTGNFFLIGPDAGPFSDSDFAIVLNPDGTLNSVNSKTTAPATGASSFIKDIAAIGAQSLTRNDILACDKGFVPTRDLQTSSLR